MGIGIGYQMMNWIHLIKKLEEITGIDYMDNPDKFDNFIEKYDKYRTLGDPNNTPLFFINKKINQKFTII